RGERYGLQARRAETVDGHPGGRDRTAGAQTHLPRDVRAGGTLEESRADQYVLDLAGIDASTLDGVAQHVTGIGHRVRHGERAAPGLRESGAGSGNDDGVGHD